MVRRLQLIDPVVPAGRTSLHAELYSCITSTPLFSLQLLPLQVSESFTGLRHHPFPTIAPIKTWVN